MKNPLPNGGAGTPDSPRTSSKFGLEIQGEPPLERGNGRIVDDRQMVEQTAPDFGSLLNDKAKQQIQQDAANDGDTPEAELQKAEYQAWQAPVEQSTKAFEQVLQDPSKAAPLAQSIDVAKKSGSQGGIGILPTLFAALAGAAKGGGATTAGLMDKWNPENIEADREKNRAAKAKNAGMEARFGDEQTARDTKAAMADPNSEESKRAYDSAAKLFEQRGKPEYALAIKGKSANEIEAMIGNIMGNVERTETVSDNETAATAVTDRNAITDEQKAAELQFRNDQQDDTVSNRDTVNALNETKQTDLNVNNQLNRESRERIAGMNKKANSGRAKTVQQADKEYAKDYSAFTSNGRTTFAKDAKNLEKSLALIDGATKDNDINFSGRFNSITPDWLKDKDGVLAESLAREAVVGMLRATLGAQFTQKEGERIFAMTYDPTQEQEVNGEKLKILQQRLMQDYIIAEDKAKYWEDNGTMDGWGSQGGVNSAERFADGDPVTFTMVSPEGERMKIPLSKMREAKMDGFTLEGMN